MVAAAVRRIRSFARGRTSKLVEIGCGTGMLAVELTRDHDYVGVDPAVSILGRLRTEMRKSTI